MTNRFSIVSALALTASVMATPAYALQYRTMGVGAMSCGSLIEKPEVKEAGIQWMLGFITAMNVWHSGEAETDTAPAADMLNGADADAVKVWLTNYCSQNPMKNISEAGVALVIEMSKSSQ